jgi:hypothetical protein
MNVATEIALVLGRNRPLAPSILIASIGEHHSADAVTEALGRLQGLGLVVAVRRTTSLGRGYGGGNLAPGGARGAAAVRRPSRSAGLAITNFTNTVCRPQAVQGRLLISRGSNRAALSPPREK